MQSIELNDLDHDRVAELSEMDLEHVVGGEDKGDGGDHGDHGGHGGHDDHGGHGGHGHP